ncbi:hypothetical protein HGRIS_013122 [Hohenbuehelia grisea]|uniref:Uncharacterized protein n=1 Tax=Hohenbuehelia grisea TaxID=104357 RepID=A0ABR3IUI5_9AGAR
MPSAPTPTSSSDLLDPTSKAYKKARRLYLKSTRNRDADIDAEWTPFRAAEKRYKARFPPPDLRGVLDLALLDETRADEVKLGVWAGQPNAVDFKEIPLNTPGSSKAYAIPDVPGLVILPGYLSHSEQRDLIRWSLADHAKLPNESNLDVHYVLPTNGLWNAYLDSLDDPDKDLIVQPRAAFVPLSDTASAPLEPSGPRRLVNNDPANTDNFQTLQSTPKPATAPSSTVPPLPVSKLLYKLRWANIGWYYHWGTKQYDFTKEKTEVHPRLHNICKSVVDCVNWDAVYEGSDLDWGEEREAWKTWHNSYGRTQKASRGLYPQAHILLAPDAGIVNFYQLKVCSMNP